MKAERGDQVVLERTDNGKVITVPTRVLSQSDIAYLKSLAQKAPAGATESDDVDEPKMVAKERPSLPEFATQPRKWTSKSGTTIVARLVSPAGDGIALRREDNGKEIVVPIAALSKVDIDFLKEVDRVERESDGMPVKAVTMVEDDEPEMAIEADTEPEQTLKLMIEPGSPFPSTKGLNSDLVAIANAIESVDKDQLKGMIEVTNGLIHGGKDMSPLLPHIAWGLQAKPHGLYASYLLKVLDPISDSPKAQSIIPDLVVYTQERLAENDVDPLYRSMPVLAKLGYYDLIEPNLLHENTEIQSAALGSIVTLLDKKVAPTQGMMEKVRKCVQQDYDLFRSSRVCAILGRIRPFDDQAFLYFDKCTAEEDYFAAARGLAAAYFVSQRAKTMLDKWATELDEETFFKELIEKSREREARLRRMKSGGIAKSSGLTVGTSVRVSVAEPQPMTRPVPADPPSNKIEVRVADNLGNLMTLAPYCQIENIPGTTWRVYRQQPPTFHSTLTGTVDKVLLQVADKCDTQETRLALLNAELDALKNNMLKDGYSNLRATKIDQGRQIGAGVQFEMSGEHPRFGVTYWYVRVNFGHPKWTMVFRAKSHRQARALELVKISETMRLLPQ